jgi:hypothetical protein
MNGPYTLEQVEATDRLAIGYVDDGAGYLCVPGLGMFWYRQWFHEFEPATDDGAGAEQWWHVEGCDCEVCHPGGGGGGGRLDGRLV